MGSVLDLTTLQKNNSSDSDFRNAVITGLSSQPKTLPCKYFYDQIGSQLFEKICELEEYYLTRTELALLNDVIEDIANYIGPDVAIIEPGSGAGKKIRLLLDSLENPASYTPVEISKETLVKSVEELSQEFPDISMKPIAGDFDTVFSQPHHLEHQAARKKVIFFPGSTIGNFDQQTAKRFLQKMARSVGIGGGLLIGVDLIKDTDILLNAYNDSEGITEAFNKNLLTRINNELGGNIDLDSFSHQSIFNSHHNRIEMHLVSQHPQTITLNDHRFQFEKLESIHTENSHKYTPHSFNNLAKEAGFELINFWCDEQQWFGTFYFEVAKL